MPHKSTVSPRSAKELLSTEIPHPPSTQSREWAPAPNAEHSSSIIDATAGRRREDYRAALASSDISATCISPCFISLSSKKSTDTITWLKGNKCARIPLVFIGIRRFPYGT